MIARLRGALLELSANRAVIAPAGWDDDDAGGGVGYEVLLPGYVSERLGGVGGVGGAAGGVVDLHTLEYLESLNQGASFVPRLIGFLSPTERAFFETLTGVKGLGNKRALRALVVSPGSVARAIADRDTAFLQRLPEIGPKLADLIVHDLKNKMDGFVRDLAGVGEAAAGAGGKVGTGAAVEPKPTGKKGKARAGGGGEGAGGSAGGGAASGRGGNGAAATVQAPVRPPVRETVAALIALGESPVDAERMVSRAVERASAGGGAMPGTTAELLSAAYAARG